MDNAKKLKQVNEEIENRLEEKEKLEWTTVNIVDR